MLQVGYLINDEISLDVVERGTWALHMLKYVPSLMFQNTSLLFQNTTLSITKFIFISYVSEYLSSVSEHHVRYYQVHFQGFKSQQSM
jgi:hypothetical protein